MKATEMQSNNSSDKKHDWRRNEETKSTFHRIIGHDYEDGVLKRDLSWWVGDQFTIQDRDRDDKEGIDDNGPDGEVSRGEHEKYRTADFTIGFDADYLASK